ncbi:MAG: diacylglycerol kinase [Thiomargarita sp.]|nr:diacylglycerol kinase [Thiomargarita sp.]
MNQDTGITRIIKATGYSIAGLKAAWIHEAAFRQEVLLCIILIPLGFWLGDTGVERALLMSSLLLIVLMELLNSAIEALSDRLTQEQDPLIKRAKDIGSAAVFVAICYAGIVWTMVLAT